MICNPLAWHRYRLCQVRTKGSDVNKLRHFRFGQRPVFCRAVLLPRPGAGRGRCLSDQPGRRDRGAGMGRRTPSAGRSGASRRHLRLSAGRAGRRGREAARRPRKLISAGLKAQYRGEVPSVTVSVKNPSGFQFSVIGKVKGPGAFTPGRYVNALEALSIAGGPSEFAQTAQYPDHSQGGQPAAGHPGADRQRLARRLRRG